MIGEDFILFHSGRAFSGRETSGRRDERGIQLIGEGFGGRPDPAPISSGRLPCGPEDQNRGARFAPRSGGGVIVAVSAGELLQIPDQGVQLLYSPAARASCGLGSRLDPVYGLLMLRRHLQNEPQRLFDVPVPALNVTGETETSSTPLRDILRHGNRWGELERQR